IANVAAAGNQPVGRGAGEMIRRGFRATLDTSSLLTGTKVVAIKQIPDAPPATIGIDGNEFVIPSSESGGLDSITAAAAELLTKINRIDFEAIGAGLAGTAKGLDGIVNGPQLKHTLESLEGTMADARDFARKLDAGAGPAMAKLPDIANQLDSAITQINRLSTSLNAGYGGDSRFNRELDRLMPQLNEAVRSFLALADLLARNPEALIKGRNPTEQRMSIGRRSFACLVLPALAAACSSSEPVLYTLEVKPGAQFAKSPPVVQVRDIGLARYLDRREIVRSSAGYKLGIAGNDWWGESLAGMLSRVIVLGLSQRLPSSSVYAEGGAISADPNAVLAVNIQRLEPDASGANVDLLAQAAVEFNRPRRTANRSFRIVKPIAAATVGAPAVGAQVAATSEAIGELTDGLAALLAQ